MKFIWAARGFKWGFTFLEKGGLDDPRGVYLDAMRPISEEFEGLSRSASSVAVRFVDPLGREDESGRPITHDFVVFGSYSWASVDEARDDLWPVVAERYKCLWNPDDAGRPYD